VLTSSEEGATYASALERGGTVSGSGTRIVSISGLRGVVGDGLDPAVAVEFAAAYASTCERGPIVVGHDGRVSAPLFAAAVAAGVTATGRDVLHAGAAATPTMGMLVRDVQAAGGIQISASHNPPQYNGIKLFQPAGMVLSRQLGQAVVDRWTRREFGWANWSSLGTARTLDDPDRGHLDRVLQIIDTGAIKRRKFKIVLDACHGAGGRLGRKLFEVLGCDAILLGEEPDGRYDHLPEPTENNLKDFAATVAREGAVAGFAQDPDADRLAIVDEHGRYIGEELTLALAAQRRLSQVEGPVVLNLSTSRVTEDLAGSHGCPVVRTAVGEINVVEAMIAQRAVLGGEGNGGVIDPRVGYVRDSFVAMALVLDLLAETGQPLSELVARLPRYVMVKDQYALGKGSAAVAGSPDGPSGTAALFDRIIAAHPTATADRRDGLRLEWDDRWVHVRGSNTEPIVRVIAEASEPEQARELAREIGRFVTHFGEGTP
jgi:phosphomannomutase